jgi:hypothetical protein
MQPNRLDNSSDVSSPYRVISATFALNSDACCLRFETSDLVLVEDQLTAKRSLCQRPIFEG